MINKDQMKEKPRMRERECCVTRCHRKFAAVEEDRRSPGAIYSAILETSCDALMMMLMLESWMCEPLGLHCFPHISCHMRSTFNELHPPAPAEKAALINDTLRGKSFVNLFKQIPTATGSAIDFDLMYQFRSTDSLGAMQS